MYCKYLVAITRVMELDLNNGALIKVYSFEH